jgi:hypothetical protein
MSVNTPILQQILSELREIRNDVSVLRKDVDGVKRDVDSLRFDFNEFKVNTQYFRKNLILTQEKTDAEFFRQYLDNTNPSLVVESYSFGEFYSPNGNIITDIDGCVTLHTIPQLPNTTKYKINNSKQIAKELIRNEIFFLESKNLLDKNKLDEKIIQFYKIYTILTNLNRINTSSSAPSFKSMITSYPLSRKPTRIYFMMCANDMSVIMRMFITEINNGTLDEEKYMELSFRMFFEHPNYKLYKSFIKENPKLRKKYEACKSFNEMKLILQHEAFNEHRKFINSFFCSYESISEYYKFLAGLIGYIFQGSVTLPSGF